MDIFFKIRSLKIFILYYFNYASNRSNVQAYVTTNASYSIISR